MTKGEAIEAMQKRERVTHMFFSEHEWVTMDKDGYIVTEEGYVAYPEQFWADRNQPTWNEGWSLYVSSPIQSETEVSEG